MSQTQGAAARADGGFDVRHQEGSRDGFSDHVGAADAELGVAGTDDVIVVATNQARRFRRGNDFDGRDLRDLLGMERSLDLEATLEVLFLEFPSRSFRLDGLLQFAIAALEALARFTVEVAIASWAPRQAIPAAGGELDQ